MGPDSVPSAIPAQPPIILIVDADTDTRALYRMVFESAGYVALEACDGRDAMIRAFERPPALVVMEIALPHVDGCSLAEILRRDRTTSAARILVVTAEISPAAVQRARKSGADVILHKPVTTDRLLVESERLLTSTHDARTQEPAAPADLTIAADGRPPRSLSKSFARSTTPRLAPMLLTCPSCDRPLTYTRSHIGGVNESSAEQWDDYSCPSCGTFQYRHRTRKLRRTGP